MLRCAIVAVLLATAALLSESRLRSRRDVFENTILRLKRQTFVSSSGNANGTGDVVNGTAEAYHYKNPNGDIGMNVSSMGNASGATGASIVNVGQGQVGDMTLGGRGNISATGANSNVFSAMFGQIYGGLQSVTNTQAGSATGTGDTAVRATGQSAMTADGQPNPANSDQNVAIAGATGSDKSLSSVASNQTLTWNSLRGSLLGTASGSGVGHAQANVGLGAGNNNNGVENNALVSGVSQGGGNVDTSVNGSATIDGQQHQLGNTLVGSVGGSGPSQLVGAGNLQSNQSGTNQTISTFGDAKTFTNGTSNMNLSSESNNTRGEGVNGGINMNSNTNSADKNMTVQNGLQVNDNQGKTLAIGFGSVSGNGTENSNGTITVDSKYNQNGEAEVTANGEGQAISKDKNSSLNIGGNAMVETNGVTKLGSGLATGHVSGANNNLTGSNLVSITGSSSNGQATMEANGGGAGPSGADTAVSLDLGNGQTSNVTGNVVASGDQTSVRSLSTVTDNNGAQTLTNFQQASSSAKGASSVSASNSGWLRRRKRASLGMLAYKLWK